VTVGLLLLIFIFIGREAIPFVTDPGAGELAKTRWAPFSFQKAAYGIVPFIAGTILVGTIAVLLAVPFSIAGAIYLAELATPLEREILKPIIEFLASIPSVAIGFFGLVVVAPLIKSTFAFLDVGTGTTALTGALLLALMAVPTILTISEDALRGVPASYRRASMSLGASRVQTVLRVSLPAACPGIFAAVMLGIGRVIGETMTVMMVTGNASVVTLNPLDPVQTMTSAIASEMGDAVVGSPHYAALYCIGIVLLFATFGLNLMARRFFDRDAKAASS